MRRFARWLTRDYTPEDFAALRVMTIILWAFIAGFVVGRFLG